MNSSEHKPQRMPENHCAECGAALRQAGEYHPYSFCVLKKAGLDPWHEVRMIAGQLQIGDPGERPPLVTRMLA